MAAVCDLLWLGLLHEDPGLTVEQVGGMVDADNYLEVFDALGRAFRDGFPGASAENPTMATGQASPSTGPKSAESALAGSASYPTSSGG